MDDTHMVTVSDDGDNGTDQIGSIFLGIVSTLDDGIEQLSTTTEIHDQMDILFVLVGASQVGDVGMTLQMMHDLDFTLDIFDVFSADELALRDGLASVSLIFSFGFGKAGGTELTTAQHFTEMEVLGDILQVQ